MAVDMYGSQQPLVLFPPTYVVPSQHTPAAGWFVTPPPSKYHQGSIPRSRNSGGKRRWSRGSDSGGISLHKMQAENRKKARRYFRGSFGQTPRRCVPRAPEHSPSVLLQAPGSVLTSPFPGGSGFHAVTPNPFKPGTAWRNGLGTVDKEAADIGKTMGIDMFGSNAGLIASKSDHADTEGDADGSDLEDPFGFELQFEDDSSLLPASARAQIEEQQAYIAQLEEQSLNLQEKLFIAEQQVKELQARLAGGRRDSILSCPSEDLDRHGCLFGTSDDDHPCLGRSLPSGEEHSHLSGSES